MKQAHKTLPPPTARFIAIVLGALSDPKFFVDLLASISSNSKITYLLVDPPLGILKAHCALPIIQATPRLLLKTGEVVLVNSAQYFCLKDNRLHLAATKDTCNPLLSSITKSNPSPCALILIGNCWSEKLSEISDFKANGGVIITNPLQLSSNERTPSTLADFSLTATEIPSHLDQLLNGQPSKETLSLISAEQLRKLSGLVKRHTGLDISSYKSEGLSRRIARRLAVCGIQSPSKYITYIQKNTIEAEHLAKEMLIKVTSFFRDKEVFARLRENIIPGIVSDSKSMPIRVWVPACATGEEAYSIAILFDEALREKGLPPEKIKIFATDLDQNALAYASKGIYPQSIREKVSPTFLERYFELTGHSYQIIRGIRERIVFAKHNAIKDPPFTRLDLVSCRNLLIYLNSAAQQRILNSISFALRPGGTLVLGQSESVGENNDHLSLTDPKTHVYYKKLTHKAKINNDLCFSPLQSVSTLFEYIKPTAMNQRITPNSPLIEAFTNKILSHTDKTCFVLNKQREVLYSFGNLSKYSTLTNGRTSLRLPDLLPEEISIPLSTALDHVESGNPVRFGPIHLKEGSHATSINLFVETFRISNDSDTYILTFIEEDPSAHSPDQTSFDNRQLVMRIKELEDEIGYQKGHLNSVCEELEASREELQTSNEELQAANEELQSTNEELESVNEELQTVNGEYQEKIHELTRSNEELDNFITSTDIATIFLDPELRIRRFTPSAAKLTGIMSHDQGRLITDFSHSLLAEAHIAAKSIINGESLFVKSITNDQLGTIILRSSPYIRKNGAHAGATISFIPVTL